MQKNGEYCMSNCLTFIKSKYPVTRMNMILPLPFCILIFSGMAGWRIYLFKNVPKNFLLLYIYFITFLFYVGIYFLKRHQLSGAEYISEHSKRCFNQTKKCLYYFFAFIVVVLLLVVFSPRQDSSDVYNVSLLFFIGIIGYLLMNYQFIVGFGSVEYISGDGKLRYDEIEKMEEIKRVQTMDGILVYSKIKLFNGKACYDKFLMDEYIFLVNKISKERGVDV